MREKCPNTEIHRISPYSVQIRENTDQKKLRSWTLFMQRVLKTNLCHYNDAYILLRGHKTIIGHNVTQAPFIRSITKIYGTTTDNPKNPYLVLSMYDLLEYN